MVYSMIGQQLSQFTSTLMSIVWFRECRVLQTCRTCETLLHHIFWRFNLIFDILTGEMVFQGVGGGSERIEVFEKMLTGSPFLSSRRFSLVLYAHSLFSLVRTDRETGIINEIPWCYLWCNGVQIKKNSSFRVSAFPFLINVSFTTILWDLSQNCQNWPISRPLKRSNSRVILDL